MKCLAESLGKLSETAARFIPAAVMVLMLVTTAIPAEADIPLPEDSEEPQLAPLNPEFEAYLEGPPEISYGYVPPPMDLSHLDELVTQEAEPMALPGKFDWRDQGKVTPVKNQNPCGTCWTFGTTSVLESAVFMTESTAYDFSEQSVALCVDRSWVYLYDQWDDPCGLEPGHAGGNTYLASEVFIKKGSVLETCNPYDTSALQCDGTCVCDGCSSVKRVDGYRLVTNDGSQINAIKDAVYDHGPVAVSYYHDDAYEYSDSTWGTIYDYYPGPDVANHCISIVGWDDDVPHPNPSHGGTGAWIVKNSWGTGYGNGGYFYLAYNSSHATEVAYLQYKDHNPNEELLYWDEAGHVGGRGWDDTAWMASVFTAPRDGYVTHVDFWTTSSNAQYEIYIWNGRFGTEVAHQTGSCVEQGYYSISLSDPISMPSGQQFTIGVKMTTPGYVYPIPVEGEIAGTVDPLIQSNVSFIRHTAGDSWTDLASYGNNACLRARMSSEATPNVGITKQVIGSDFAPGDPIIFRLAIVNSGNKVASQVVVTDFVPAEVLSPTFASTLAITPTGTLPYVWNVEPLGIGQGGVITIYGWIDPGLGSDFSFTNIATISDPEDSTPGNNTSSVTVTAGERKIYLPLVIRNYPPPPPGTFTSVGDACVIEGYPTTNLGDTTDMWAGYDDYLSPDGKIVRSLIQFDVSVIPSGISIDSAVLQVYLVDSWDYPNRTRTITTYRIGSAWSESSVTWNTRPSCAEAYGSASVTHGSFGWYSFDVTNLVSGWVNGSLPNYGVMLRGPEGSGSDSSWRGFSTREGPYTPQLVITYSGYTTSADAWLADESLSEGEPARVIIEALAGRPNADSPGISLCQPYSPVGEKCLALP